MVDLSQFGTIAGLAALIALIIRFVYPEDWPKPVKPYTALGLGIVLALVIGLALGKIHVGADWLSWGIGGFMAGVTATGGYEATKQLMPT